MNILEERIRKEGIVKSKDVLIVDKFLNQQMDPVLFHQMAEEWKTRFKGVQVDKILTVEASGIGLAIVAAEVFQVPCVFAKKTVSINLVGDVYTAEAESFTHGGVNTLMVSKRLLNQGEHVLLIDDFLANGRACEALLKIVQDAGAVPAGIGIGIEKGFQTGGKALRESGYKVESLAIVKDMGKDNIQFEDNPWLTQKFGKNMEEKKKTETAVKYTIRNASGEDADLLTELRFAQLQAEGNVLLYDTRAEMRTYFRKHLSDGTYRAWIAEINGEAVSAAAVLYQEYPPSIDWNGAHRGYVTSVYTRPQYRHQGIASALLKEIIRDAEEKKLGNLWLMASPQAKHLYESCGFSVDFPGNDTYMEWFGNLEK